MKHNWKRSIAIDNFKLFRENARDRMMWERDAVRFDDFRYGIQLSRLEEEQLLAFRQAPLAISITTAICDAAESMMVASKPIIKTAPIINPYDENLTEISRKVAQKYNYLVQKSWYDSMGNLQYDRVVRDSSNVGHGFFYIVPRDEYGEFSVDIKHINWRYVYPHKMTKDPFYRDMDNCSIAMRVSKDYAYRFLKTFEEDLTVEEFEEEFVKGAITMASGPANQNTKYLSSYGAGKNSPILFNLNIKLEEYEYYLVVPKISDSEYHAPVVKTYFELTDDVKKMIAEEKAVVRKRKGMFLTENLAVGNQGMKRKYPIQSLNIVPLVYDHRDNPYPHGRIWYLYPIQRTFNKMVMIALLNGALLNATRVIAEERSIVDSHEWDVNFATPGARLFYRVVGNPNNYRPPQIIEGKPLGEAWLQFPRFLLYAMEYVSGIWGVMQGNSIDSPNVFSTVAALQSAGGQKIKRRLAHADSTLSVVGRIVGEFYKEYAPLNGFATQIDDTGQMKEPILYNQLRINNDNRVEIIPETDLSYGFKDIRFTTQGSNGYEAGTEAAMLTNLATQLNVPQLVPLILRRLNIPDVDKIVDSMNLVANQAATIEQLTKTLEDVEKRARVLAGTVTQKSFEVSKAQFDAKFAKLLADYKAQLQTTIQGNGNGR